MNRVGKAQKYLCSTCELELVYVVVHKFGLKIAIYTLWDEKIEKKLKYPKDGIYAGIYGPHK